MSLKVSIVCYDVEFCGIRHIIFKKENIRIEILGCALSKDWINKEVS